MNEIELFPKRPLVMIIDDVPRNIQVVAKILDGANYDVSYATNANDALKVLNNQLPDLILLDVMMPDIDGFELCNIIKQQKQMADIPIVFLTARISPEDIVKGFQCGAVDYILKPFNIKELLVRIKNHLDLKFSREIIRTKIVELNQANELLKEINLEKDKYLNIINKEMESAADYVISLLPKPISKGNIKADWLFIPSSGLGGDSFGYRNIDRDHFSFYLLDVCGHGIKSALHSVSILNVLNYQTLPKVDFRQPSQVLYFLNDMFQMEDYDDLFFSIFYGVYNRKTRELIFANAGHPPALLLDTHSNSKELCTPNKVMGFLKEIDIISNTITIEPKTDVYIYSDGAYEIKLSNGRRWEYKDLNEYIRFNKTNLGDELINIYKHTRESNGNNNLPDDFSILKISFE